MAETFSPAIPPSQPLKISVTPRVMDTPFGDGHGQVIPDGINFLLMDPTQLVWLDISTAEVDALEAFMIANFAEFLYTMPSESSARKLQASSWSRGLKRGALIDFTVDVKEIP